jgi:hypothetical protein
MINFPKSNNPWLSLKTPKDKTYFSTRRITKVTEHEFFWIKSYKDEKGILLNLNKQATNLKNFPHFKNLFFRLIKNKMTFTLFLNKDVENDKFYLLCCNIIHCCINLKLNDTDKIIKKISDTLKDWELIFEKKLDNSLTLSNELGLLGELLVLKDIIIKNTDIKTGINSWRGPHGDHQDFSYRNYLFEVKTKLNSSKNTISISSLEQLDNFHASIYIILNSMSICEEQQKGSVSLDLIINDILNILNGFNFERDVFLSKLLLIGINVYQTINHQSYMLTDREIYYVNDDFPKITRTNVSSSISKANYEININDLAGFTKSNVEFCSEVFLNG